MYVYLITNNINNKKYVGITNNYKKRFGNHKCSTKQIIGKAIQKYGSENFSFDVIEEDLTIEEAKEKERHYIKFYNSIRPNGYNISDGGDYLGGIQKDLTPRQGIKNGRAILNEEQVRFIKDHRNKPKVLLYEEFINKYNVKISKEAFEKVYLNKTYKEIEPTVDVCPYNASFSNMLRASSFTLEEICKMRKQYQQIIPWQEVYKEYSDRVVKERFWQIYNGYGAMGKYIMPEVFTEENKHKHSKLKGNGEKNPNAKLSELDVKNIREKYKNGITFGELYLLYPQVTHTTIRDICNYKTWKSVC